MKASEDELYEAVMTAGIIGVLMMVDGNEFSGGTHGCQAEVAWRNSYGCRRNGKNDRRNGKTSM